MAPRAWSPRTPPPGARCRAISFAALSLLVAPRFARAYDVDVASTTAAQGYEVRSPYGDPIVDRRRLTQTLGLGVYDILGGEKPGGPQLFVKVRLRLDSDLGVDPSETTLTRNDPDSRFLPGLSPAPVDLMYGYVEGRNFAGGWLGFRAGRQYVVDSLGWWSFDGGLLRVQTPYVKVEGYGGFEQRGGLPLSTPRFESGGVWRGDRSSYGSSPDLFSSFLSASSAPAFGASAETTGLGWIHARVDYRKVYDQGVVVTNPFVDSAGRLTTISSVRTSSERAGVAVDTHLDKVGALRAGAVYDAYNAFVSQYFASLDAYASPSATLTAEYEYYKPTFDGDSIWNWFTHSAIGTASGRAAVTVDEHVSLAASGGVRVWETADDDASPAPANPAPGVPSRVDATGHLVDVLASVDGRLREGWGRAGVRGSLEAGERGRREGVDLDLQRDLSGGKYRALARTSVYDWRDELRPDRSATSFGYVIGGGWRPSRAADVLLEWEHNTNRLVGQQYRVLAIVNLLVTK